MGLYSEILVCINVYNVYIPPKSSLAQARENPWDSLAITMEFLTYHYPKAHYIICGDFNACIGSGSRDVSPGTNAQIALHATLLERSSMDAIVNKFGLRFLELLSLFDLHVLHGTYYDISGGTFTYLSTCRASTIDYIAISPGLLNLVSYFEVGNCSWSDYCPLRVLLNSSADILLKPIPGLAEDTVPGFRRLRWSEQLNNKLHQSFKTSELETQRLTLLQSSNDIIKRYEAIVEHLKPLLTNNRPVKALPFVISGWFDHECKALKKTLTSCMRQVRRGNVGVLMSHLLQLRSQYKNLLKQKKSDYARQLWKELDLAVSEKNDTRFWELVSNGLSSSSCHVTAQIPGKVWFEHFSKVFEVDSPITSDLQLLNISFDILGLPSWPPVTEAEIRGLISSLPSGKAPGEDLIPLDLFKAFSDWWAPVLAKVFTQINKLGKMPSGWKSSIIVPIFKKGDRTGPQNYRPISLLDVSPKLYSKFLLQKLEDWINENKVIHPQQAGFRRTAPDSPNRPLLRPGAS